MQIKIKRLTSTAKLPRYAKVSDAGMDIYADETYTLQPGERRGISTGISFELPQGYVALVWDKSGVAFKAGLKTMGGVVDAGYRGEIKIIIHNLSKEAYHIEQGKKIAQILIQKVEQPEIIEATELSESDRGTGGFGSTGLD